MYKLTLGLLLSLSPLFSFSQVQETNYFIKYLNPVTQLDSTTIQDSVDVVLFGQINDTSIVSFGYTTSGSQWGVIDSIGNMFSDQNLSFNRGKFRLKALRCSPSTQDSINIYYFYSTQTLRDTANIWIHF